MAAKETETLASAMLDMDTPEDPELRLVLLMRTEMKSMGRGRSVAQGTHGGNVLTHRYIITPLLLGQLPNPKVLDWTKQTPCGFGTTIVLDGIDLATIKDTLTYAKSLDIICDMVIDPQYFVEDGDAVHELHDVPTGAYFFGRKDDLDNVLRPFVLLPNDPVPHASWVTK